MANDDVNWTKALDELRGAPVKSDVNVSLKQKILASLDDILAAREKGYSDADILEILRRNGVETTLGTLRHYIAAARKARSTAVEPLRATPPIKGARGRHSEGEDRRKPSEPPMEPIRAQRPVGGTSSPAPSIAAAAQRPLRQLGKPAREVLGHRLDDNEL